MGGNALKNTYTRRCDVNEFNTISKELLSILKECFERVEIPLSYKNKDSFGDIDIVCQTSELNNINIKKYLEETFKPNEIYHNANCYSFDYKEIQIDLLHISKEYFDCYVNYLNYNDLGNYIGRISQCLGFKYGQKGFYYEHKFKGMNIGDIEISKDIKKIFEFLDLDYNKYLNGFDTVEDTFNFVYSSKYFSGPRFKLNELNHTNRHRNSKRKNYIGLLEWIQEQPEKIRDFGLKEEYVAMVDNEFPDANLIENIRRLEYEHCKSLYIKSKFNGGDIMNLFGLKGKELGDALTEFKDNILYHKGLIYKSFEEYVLDTSKEDIFNDFKKYLK